MASRLRTGIGTRISFFAFQDIITSVTGILILVTFILTLYLEPTPPRSAEQQALKQTLASELETLRRAGLELELRQTNLLLLAAAPSAEQLQAEIGQLQAQLASQSNRLVAAQQQAVDRTTEADRRADRVGLAEELERAGRIQQEIGSLRETNTVLVTELRQLEEQTHLVQAAAQRVQTENKLWLLPETGAFAKQPVLVTVSAGKVICERFQEPGSRQEFPAASARRDLAQNLARWNVERDYVVFYVRPSGIDAFNTLSELARQAGFQIGYDAVEEDRQIVFANPNAP